MRRNLKNLFVLGGILLGTSLYAQEKTVTGTVTDPEGFPVADAVVKTTSGKEVYTDENGVFSIEAKQGDLVTVEAVGLPTQTFAVGAGTDYKVTLKPSEIVELEGAVVTALGITRDKKSLGYASQEVKGDLLTNSRSSNPLAALSGNVAGAQISTPSGNIGGSARITLRGISSITGENRPLIVIDGVPLDNSNYNSTNTQRGAGGRDYGDASFDINPDDIESMSVLKGGPATALYGSRAGNGVILITTKRGKKGRDFKNSLIDATTNGGLIIKNLYNLSNGYEPATVTNGEYHKRINSVFGGASLGFADMLYLDLGVRNDWSSTLPSSNNSFFYPSATLSFVFSEVIKQNWLTFGKIRGGWSKSGNDTDPYKLNDIYLNSIYNSVSFGGDPYFMMSLDKNNPNLRPETKKSWEIGLEMAMFKSRLSFDVTYYNQKTSDLIFPVQVGPDTGYNRQYLNAGEMENKGIEAMVNIVPIRTEEFEWGMSFNFAKNENKLLSLTEDIENLVLTNAPFNAQLVAAVGEKYGQIRGTDFVYDDKGNKVVGADGLYLSSDIKNLGSILPDYNLGIRNSFSYKGFSLSALLDIQKGGKYFSTSNIFGMNSGMLEETAANGVRENGIVSKGVVWDATANGNQGAYVENTKVVEAMEYFPHYYSGPAAQNVFDASYVKLREVTLSYTFPERFRGPFANVVVTAFGRNLATWGLDNKNFDPEMTTAGSGNIQGFEGGSLPSTRSFGMNLKLQF
ncbi:TonB-dependent receptor domain-containing protein [Empedobacter tilapiae]|uniref:TonB-dependent receptor n=1 Tax=Empedobacter tilapiae TaxID=2491114 RepID=A0A4Z1BR77_9FLAO|nr:TonB-dependent receptor [Empedobacter tilapiae]TGN30050.1 TonB-dependent receptor [Empedobacter tilapiae]